MSESLSNAGLTPEERCVWECARTWRSPAVPGGLDALDWSRVVEIARSNYVQALLHRVLSATGLLEGMPAPARQALEAEIAQLGDTARLLGQALRQYLRLASERGIETVVLKGLSASLNFYGDPAVRPGSDIDILVRRDDVAGCLDILEQMGLGQWWPTLLDDAFYARHHLHQQRCSQDFKLWFEIHWALDHPYTLLTPDYEALMDRSARGTLLGEPVRELALRDLLLAQAIHLVKHFVALPSVLDRPDLRRIVLAEGMLIYFLDMTEAIGLRSEASDWALTAELARQWGATDILGAVLRVCRDFLDAPVPGWVLDSLPVRGHQRLIRRAMNELVDDEVTAYLGGEPSRFWRFMLMTNGAFILRPIRMLDTAAYFIPDAAFLQRRYGSASWLAAAGHAARAAGQYGRLGVDTVYYTWQRHRRLKALGRGASLFQPLEIEP